MGQRVGWVRPGVLVALAALAALDPAQAQVKPRVALILPFSASDLAPGEQWVGEAVGQSLSLALVHLPSLIQVERSRRARLATAERWDDQTVLQAARSARADVALYGDVKRVGADLVIHPRLVEVRGDRPERLALEPVTAGEGALLDALRGLPVAYARSLRIAVNDADIGRMQRSAAPTTSMRALQAYVQGEVALLRGTQDGNEAAVEFLGRAVEVDPQFAVAQFALGRAHQALGNRWKATAQYRAAAQGDPSYPEPYRALGDQFVTAPRRLYDQAIEAYAKAIELRPFYADAYVGLGDVKAAKGDVDGAVAAYQKAIGFNPYNARVQASLAKIYFSEKGLYYESVTAYKKALELDPFSVDARMGLAEVYEDKGLYPDAIAEYRKVVEQDPKHTGALYNLALVYEKVDAREAISLWERYIELAGSSPQEKDWVDVAKLHLRKLKNQVERGK